MVSIYDFGFDFLEQPGEQEVIDDDVDYWNVEDVLPNQPPKESPSRDAQQVHAMMSHPAFKIMVEEEKRNTPPTPTTLSKKYTDHNKMITYVDLQYKKDTAPPMRWKKYARYTRKRKTREVIHKPYVKTRVKNYKTNRENIRWASYDEAREFYRSVGVYTWHQMREYVRLHGVPTHIPTNPDRMYKDQWISWTEFFYPNPNPRRRNMSFLSYEEAVKVLHPEGLQNYEQYLKFRLKYNKGKNRNRLPRKPEEAYRSKYKSIHDFIGASDVSTKIRGMNMLPFKQARAYARTLGLKNRREWDAFVQSDDMPYFIPKWPCRKYPEFKGYIDWLGADVIAQLDLMQKTEYILIVGRNIHEPNSYVYRFYNSGVAGIRLFQSTTDYEIVRVYEFDKSWMGAWKNLINNYSFYHEYNLFSTNHIDAILFDADNQMKRRAV